MAFYSHGFLNGLLGSFVGVALVLSLSACGPEVVSKKTGQARTAVELPEGTTVATTAVRGGVKATLDPNSTEAQLISVTSGSLQGVTIAFPVGALAVPMTISVTPGVTMSGAALLNNLGVKNNSVTASGAPVEITADVARDLRNPMVLSLPLPKAASLVDSGTVSRGNLAVLYRIKMSESSDEGAYTGLVPASELGWADGSVLFETKYFGWFSVVALETPAPAAIQVKRRDADMISAKRFGTKADLPACTTADIDRLAYVASEDALYYCAEGGTWTLIEEEEFEMPDPFDPSGLPAPLQLIDGNEEVVGRLVGTDSNGRWRLLIEDDNSGELYMLLIDLDNIDPNVNIQSTSVAEPYTYSFAASGCSSGVLSGTGYLKSDEGTQVANLVFYLSTQVGTVSNLVAGLYETNSGTSTPGGLSYSMTSMCYSLTSPNDKVYAVSTASSFVSSMFPIAAPWRVQ
jgi:hypothetical protein